MVDYVNNIRRSGLSIYDSISPADEHLYIPTPVLEEILNTALHGLNLAGFPLRTRAKVVKTEICKALGYPVPKSFAKTQPRFPSQNFDVYTQKSLNLQIWNEDIDSTRRYVLIRIDENDVLQRVKVLTGDQLAIYDNTGTLTTKFQAKMRHYGANHLFSPSDTVKIRNFLARPDYIPIGRYPNSKPDAGTILPIDVVYSRLLQLVGTTIRYLDAVQERNRGAELHQRICECLGYRIYVDDGSYPDILNQLIEIKLQMSPTIDLGLHSPNEESPFMNIQGVPIQSADVRYVIFDASFVDDSRTLVNLDYLYVVTGADFATYFPLFGGKVQNAKIQLPLPSEIFD